jgi:SynChlorMet cassette protein ScmD
MTWQDPREILNHVLHWLSGRKTRKRETDLPLAQKIRTEAVNVSQPDNPIANTQIVLREEFDDWAILFDPDSGEAYGLNPVGVFIWKRLDGTQTLASILKALKEECDEVPEDAEQHVGEFLEDLANRGFVGYEVKTSS